MAGAVVVTGPSSCGKGEVSKALCERLAIPTERWLSMGAILRAVCDGTHDDAFIAELDARHAISDAIPIFVTPDMTQALRAKIERHQNGLAKMFAARSGRRMRPVGWRSTTALDWLEYCTNHGLLVPNRWTQELIAARIAAQSDGGALIFDGYPRTPAAAEHLLDVLDQANIPVWKVLHLSISKQEMLHRAGSRRRADDDHEALLKRYEFYIDSVQPSVDYMKDRLGSERIALIDAHQPSYDVENGARVLNLKRSVENVVRSSLLALAAS
jgi:adenylate kinase family enzyme